MKAIRIPVFVLAVLLAFSVCNAVHLTHEHGGGDTADQREEYPVTYFSLRSLFSSLMKVLMSLNWR